MEVSIIQILHGNYKIWIMFLDRCSNRTNQTHTAISTKIKLSIHKPKILLYGHIKLIQSIVITNNWTIVRDGRAAKSTLGRRSWSCGALAAGLTASRDDYGENLSTTSFATCVKSLHIQILGSISSAVREFQYTTHSIRWLQYQRKLKRKTVMLVHQQNSPLFRPSESCAAILSLYKWVLFLQLKPNDFIWSAHGHGLHTLTQPQKTVWSSVSERTDGPPDLIHKINRPTTTMMTATTDDPITPQSRILLTLQDS